MTKLSSFLWILQFRMKELMSGILFTRSRWLKHIILFIRLFSRRFLSTIIVRNAGRGVLLLIIFSFWSWIYQRRRGRLRRLRRNWHRIGTLLLSRIGGRVWWIFSRRRRFPSLFLSSSLSWWSRHCTKSIISDMKNELWQMWVDSEKDENSFSKVAGYFNHSDS